MAGMRRTALFVFALTSCTIDNPVGTNDDAAVADTPDAPVAPADVPGSYRLTVEHLGCGEGTVTSDPAGIDCGGTCLSSFAPGTSVALTATATTGRFVGFGGACTGTDCTLPMTADRAVTATFTDIAWSHQWLTTTATDEPTGTSIHVRAAALDRDGNTWIGGYYDDVLVLEGAARCSELPGSNAFLVQLDQDGHVNWVRCFGGPSTAELVDIEVDPLSGDAFVAGSHANLESDGTPASLDLGTGPFRCTDDPTATAHFVARLAPDGTARWSRGFCLGGGFPPSIALVGSDLVLARTLSFLAGDFYATAAEVTRLDGADGSSRWVRTVDGGTPGESTLTSIAVAAHPGGVYVSTSLVVGTAGAGADFGSGPVGPRTTGTGALALPLQGMVVAAYEPSDGAPRWVRVLDVAPTAMGATVASDEIVVDALGNPVLDGLYYYGAVDVAGTSLPPAAGEPSATQSYFVASLAAADGAHVWSHSLTCELSGTVTGYGGMALARDAVTDEVLWVGGLEGRCALGSETMSAVGARAAFAVRFGQTGAPGALVLLDQAPGPPTTLVEWEAVATAAGRVVLGGLLRGAVDRCGETFVSPDGVNETVLVVESAFLGARE